MNLFVSFKYLLALDEQRHFGRAALACHVTQPALSNALRALEESLGVAIVTRGRSFAGFTTEGERVLASARRMLREHELLQQELQSSADVVTHAQRICIVNAIQMQQQAPNRVGGTRAIVQQFGFVGVAFIVSRFAYVLFKCAEQVVQ